MATVVLTRPQGKNQALASALHAQGLDTLILPALALTPTLTTLPLSYQPANFDLLIFVSAQAAQSYLDALAAADLVFLPNQKIATVGAASAQPFHKAGLAQQLHLIHPPADHPYQDSEALWELLQPQLDEFERVLLVRGQQGREWLSQKLVERQKKITRCCIYERLPAVWSEDAIRQLRQALLQPQTVTMLLSSSESTRAIYTNIKRLNLISAWQQINFVAIHPRIVECLEEITFLSTPQLASQIRLCAPSQPAMLEALLSVAMPTNA